jgi:hypothetical protein
MLFAFALALQSRPDFSGLWRLNLEKSTLRGQAPTELLTKIQHREPTLIQTTVIVAGDGREQRQTFTFDTTGGESTNVVGGWRVRTSTDSLRQ